MRSKLVKGQHELIDPYIITNLSKIPYAGITKTIGGSLDLQFRRRVDPFEVTQIGQVVVMEKRGMNGIDSSLDSLGVTTVLDRLRNKTVRLGRPAPFHSRRLRLLF